MGRILRAVAVSALVGLVLTAGWVSPGAAADQTGAPPPRSIWRQVSAGDRHTCGITLTGRLFCWGWDGAGQIGDGGTNTDQPTPAEVAGGGHGWATVSTGGSHTCATTLRGQLFCWGSDFWGQLGNGGANTDVSAPVQVPGTDRWSSVSAGYEHTCAITQGGRLYCWGHDGSGRLGNDGAVVGQATPVELAGGVTDWVRVSAGMFHSCAVERSGHLRCWGADSAGQLGDGAPLADKHTPVEVAGGATDWVDVSVGASHTCAVKRSGALFCWGWDAHGELGDDAALVDRATPVPVGGRITRWSGLTTGSWHTCAIGAIGQLGRLTSRVYCWGLDEKGGLGDDATLANQPLPTPVAGSNAGWWIVEAGQYHTCALSLLGRLQCWGLDSNGQLGDGGTNTDQPTPVLVAG